MCNHFMVRSKNQARKSATSKEHNMGIKVEFTNVTDNELPEFIGTEVPRVIELLKGLTPALVAMASRMTYQPLTQKVIIDMQEINQDTAAEIIAALSFMPGGVDVFDWAWLSTHPAAEIQDSYCSSTD
jgi:hypothetical protein